MIYVFIFFVLLITICISAYFIKKKVGKIIFIIAILSLLFLIIFVFRYNIIFFFESMKYEKYNSYDYSNDISQYGYITEDGAIKKVKEQIESGRISKVTCKIEENKNKKTENNNNVNSEEDSFLFNIYKINNATKYYSISCITGWDKLCGHWEEHYFIIDYYTGEVLSHSQTD